MCSSIDIRNDKSEFSILDNCTVIEGSLEIVLIRSNIDFTTLSFPFLREITDYLLLYHVKGLKSLGQLFPNLSVIRGQTLLSNYALVVYEVEDLEDVGLHSLTHILRGAVRIEKNSNLCYLKSINWEMIMKDFKVSNNIIIDNKDDEECFDVCPADGIACPVRDVVSEDGFQSKKLLCWNTKHCQLKHSSMTGKQV